MRRTAIEALCACAICLASGGAWGDEPPARTPGHALTIGPRQTIDALSMDVVPFAIVGQVVQLTNLTLHNALDTPAVDVHYTVIDAIQGTVLASGVVAIAGKGNLTLPSVAVTPVLGSTVITFSASGANNKSTVSAITKTIFAAAPGMDLRALDPSRAVTASSAAPGCTAKASADAPADKLHAPAALSTHCLAGSGKGSFILFKGRPLRNGWKIAQVVTTETVSGGSTWAFTAGPPAVGTSSAEMKLDMDVTAGAGVDVAVTVYAQGPVGSVP